MVTHELVLQLATFLRSLDLFLELTVRTVPRTLTAKQVQRGGKQGTDDPELSRIHSSTQHPRDYRQEASAHGSCAFAKYVGFASGASTRLGQSSLRRAGSALRRTEQPHGPDDVATVENAHQLGDRQFGVAVGGHKIVGELGLRRAHRVLNCCEFILHNALALCARFPGRREREATLSGSTLQARGRRDFRGGEPKERRVGKGASYAVPTRVSAGMTDRRVNRRRGDRIN